MDTSFLRSISLKDNATESDQYPFSIPAIKGLELLDLDPQITFLIGENGSGKSTLIEAIAVAVGFNPEGGSRNFSFSTHASHSSLHKHLRVARGIAKPRDGFFLRAESLYNLATEIERLDEDPLGGPPVKGAYGGKSLHVKSHGESFMALMLHRFRGHGLYILDEPEAALSPSRQLACLRLLHNLIRAGSQFLIATHSPILMAYPGAMIYLLSEHGIERVRYEDTEHYQITKMFFDRREHLIAEILGQEEG